MSWGPLSVSHVECPAGACPPREGWEGASAQLCLWAQAGLMSSPKICNAVTVPGCAAPPLGSRLLLFQLRVGRRKKQSQLGCRSWKLFRRLFTVTKIFLIQIPCFFPTGECWGRKSFPERSSDKPEFLWHHWLTCGPKLQVFLLWFFYAQCVKTTVSENAVVRMACLFLYSKALNIFINLLYICFLEQFFHLALSRLQNCGLSNEDDGWDGLFATVSVHCIFNIYLKRNVHGVILKLLKLAEMQIWPTVSKQCVTNSKI